MPLEHLADYTARLTRSLREETARAAPGMRMPRSAACMCGRCSICGSTRTSARCAPSPRKPSPWCASTKARIPASMATASCARNSTNSCSARELVHAFEEVKDRFDPQQPVQSRQDRARAEIRRPQQFPLRPGLPRRGHDDRARLVGLSGRGRRFPGRGRNVQQQRRLPRARRRRHVPELSRHPRRARRDARPRQYAAARHHRPARAGCAHLRRHGRDAEALRLLQGLPARMPDRRRHGAHEDRSAARRGRKNTACRCTTGWSAICRATRLMRRGCLGSSICATSFPARRSCRKRSPAFRAQRSLPKWRADYFAKTTRSARAGGRSRARRQEPAE